MTVRSRQVHSSPETGEDEGSTVTAQKARRPHLGRRVALIALILLVPFSALTARLFVWPSLPPLPDHADAIIELGGPGDRDAVTIALAEEHRAPLLIQSTTRRRGHVRHLPAARPRRHDRVLPRGPADHEG